jgi:hypothetical protein
MANAMKAGRTRMKAKVGLVATVATLILFSVHAESEYFPSRTWSIDAFGFYGSRDKDGGSDGEWGPGVGVNYFFNDNWGAGADTYAQAFNVPYLLNANVIFRYPLRDTKFAPYGYAGFGRQWDHGSQWLADFGAGVEYSIQKQTSAFADIRGVFPDKTRDYAVLRFGLRFNFR